MGEGETLKQHLAKEHRISPFQTYLKEIVYGGTDGIVTTFAVVAGFTGAQSGNVPGYSVLTVLLFGFANLFADAASMGLGNFLSLRAEKDVYKKEEAKELHEIQTNAQMEKEETIDILQNKGFSENNARQLTEIYATNESYWLSFMMSHELEMPNPKGENPFYTAIATFFSFLSFGFIPLIPYLLQRTSPLVFMYSCIATGSALVLLGILRWRITRETVARSVFEILLLGGTAASIAYLVGTLFRL